MDNEQGLPVGCEMLAHSRYASDDNCTLCRRGEGAVCPEYEAIAEASIAAKRAEHARRSSSDEQRAEVVGWRYRPWGQDKWAILRDGMERHPSDFEYQPLYASPSPAVAAGGVTEDALSEILSEEVARQQWTFSCDIDFDKLARAALAAALAVRDEGIREGLNEDERELLSAIADDAHGDLRINPWDQSLMSLVGKGLLTITEDGDYNKRARLTAKGRADRPTPTLKGEGE